MASLFRLAAAPAPAHPHVSSCETCSPLTRGLPRPIREAMAFESTASRLPVCFSAKGGDVTDPRLPVRSSPSDEAYDEAKVNLPPRICTLREFGKSGEGMVAIPPDGTMSGFFTSLAANIEFSSHIQDWEILSGRLAMMVFASAVLLEALTGNSVFQKLDSQKILEFCAAAALSSLVAAGFAVALQAKSRVAYSVSEKYKSLLNSLIDNVIDGLLFDEEE